MLMQNKYLHFNYRGDKGRFPYSHKFSIYIKRDFYEQYTNNLSPEFGVNEMILY